MNRTTQRPARQVRRTLHTALDAADVCRGLRAVQPVSLWLDGRGFADGWATGPLVALAPRVVAEVPATSGAEDGMAAIEAVARRWRERWDPEAGSATGIAVLLAYEALDRASPQGRDLLGAPRVLVLEVDESLHWVGPGEVEWTGRGERADAAERAALEAGERRSQARVTAGVRTSLAQPSYLEAVARLRRHIFDGDVYQANLCQVFHGPYVGDELGAYEALVRVTPAPRSAFLCTPELSVASASPELFLSLRPPDRIETRPIKGTRPRGATAGLDRALRDELVGSVKDRAELLMIVDLERNDLGRVCRTGTIETSGPGDVQSYAAVHHLVASVVGRLRQDVSFGDLVRATFPGGSISGAPKERARSLLAELEPVRRGFYTGSLFWLGDDGSLDASILIRTLVFRNGLFHLGAGGGIVADSDAELEWRESNHKARALAHVLGFAPEDAR